MGNVQDPAIEVEYLTVSYGDQIALWNLSFTIEQSGGLVGLIGCNGAGKSTLLKAILGMVQPVSGRVLIFGNPLRQVKRQIAYVPQKESIDWNFPITLFDAVLMGRYHHLGWLKWYRKADRVAVKEALLFLEIDHLADRPIGNLSGGEKQRMFMARALVQGADLLLLDEPFAAIDHGAEQKIMTILRQLRDQGKTIVIVHHDLSTVSSYFDSVVVLKTTLVAQGPPDQVLDAACLKRVFGETTPLFEEAVRLSQHKTGGLG